MKHESVLDCEKQTHVAVGVDFDSSRFWAEGENTCIFTWFVLLFFIKCAKACEANFHKSRSQFLWQPDPKKEIF